MHNRRGKIRHRDRAKQLRNFSGLQFGNITPTDIDAMIEYKNKRYFFLEIKKEGVELSYGQRLAYERLTDDLEKAGKPTIFIIASHTVDDCKNDIDAANTLVREYRFKGEWHLVDPKLDTTPKKMADTFFDNNARTQIPY